MHNIHSFQWNCKIRRNARVILLCSIVWCLVIPVLPDTTVYSGFTAIHYQRNSHSLSLSWLGHHVSIMAPLLCCQILSGMLGFCCCSQHLLLPWLTLVSSPSNAHSCRHWKHTTILRMVIISIMSLVSVMCIIRIKLIKTFQVGWNLFDSCCMQLDGQDDSIHSRDDILRVSNALQALGFQMRPLYSRLCYPSSRVCNWTCQYFIVDSSRAWCPRCAPQPHWQFMYITSCFHWHWINTVILI